MDAYDLSCRGGAGAPSATETLPPQW